MALRGLLLPNCQKSSKFSIKTWRFKMKTRASRYRYDRTVYIPKAPASSPFMKLGATIAVSLLAVSSLAYLFLALNSDGGGNPSSKPLAPPAAIAQSDTSTPAPPLTNPSPPVNPAPQPTTFPVPALKPIGDTDPSVLREIGELVVGAWGFYLLD